MKVTVITATTGNPLLADCLRSVANQTHKDIQHLVITDGPERWAPVNDVLVKVHESGHELEHVDILDLPYSIGKDRWNGHRIYGAGTFVAEGDYFIYLDDDNYLEPNHIESCIKKIEEGNDWVYSFRNIVDKNRNFIAQDNCESLGKWPSVLHPQDYFVDVNCYFLPKPLAVQITPVWYRKFREPGQMEIDRAICHVLRQIAPKHDTTYEYTVNYTVGNSENSVQGDFFIHGNADMLQRFEGKLPWKQ